MAVGKFLLCSGELVESAALAVEPDHTACSRDEPFGLLTIAALQHKLGINHSGDLTMYRALVSTILAAFVASAHAHPNTSTSIIKPEPTTATTQVTLQKASDTVKVRAPRELPTAANKESTPPVVSAWGKYGTLLATLVVMCAIAVRRQRLGRS